MEKERRIGGWRWGLRRDEVERKKVDQSHAKPKCKRVLQAAGMVHRALSLRGATALLLRMSNPGTARARYIVFETCVHA